MLDGWGFERLRVLLPFKVLADISGILTFWPCKFLRFQYNPDKSLSVVYSIVPYPSPPKRRLKRR